MTPRRLTATGAMLGIAGGFSAWYILGPQGGWDHARERCSMLAIGIGAGAFTPILLYLFPRFAPVLVRTGQWGRFDRVFWGAAFGAFCGWFLSILALPFLEQPRDTPFVECAYCAQSAIPAGAVGLVLGLLTPPIESEAELEKARTRVRKRKE